MRLIPLSNLARAVTGHYCLIEWSSGAILALVDSQNLVTKQTSQQKQYMYKCHLLDLVL